MNDFLKASVSPHLLIIDDGWQNINVDGENLDQDARNFILGGIQMIDKLHRLDECEKFKKYAIGSLLCPSAPWYDQRKIKTLI